MSQTMLRDDTLRLLFAEVQTAMLEERLMAIRGGAMLLLIALAWTALFTYALDVRQVAIADSLGAYALVIGVVWVVALGTSILSPLIVIMLAVEYRRARRDMAEHEAFLAQYGRVPAGG